jgi:P27 family predicted phage terminase small subunit
MRGPPPKPIEQKKREGNLSKRPLAEPLPTRGAPEPPDDLPAEARKLWLELIPELDLLGILDPADRPALSAMCIAWARACAARRVLAAEGMFTQGSMGQPVEHPAIMIEQRAHAQFLRFATEFGATASGRARIAAARGERGDDGSALFTDELGASPRLRALRGGKS